MGSSLLYQLDQLELALKSSKTCFTEIHLSPGGRAAQSKMAAVRLHGSSTIDDKIIWYWHEIYQKVCILGQGVEIWYSKKLKLKSFLSKFNMAAEISENQMHILTIL